MKKHEILEEGLRKLQAKKGPGKGWWGPPKGSHTGEGGGATAPMGTLMGLYEEQKDLKQRETWAKKSWRKAGMPHEGDTKKRLEQAREKVEANKAAAKKLSKTKAVGYGDYKQDEEASKRGGMTYKRVYEHPDGGMVVRERRHELHFVSYTPPGGETHTRQWGGKGGTSKPADNFLKRHWGIER